jgi:cobalt-zinc-cadmium efflux system membrane fusion protein
LPIAGYVKSTIEVLPGKQVTKGLVLATITSMDYIQMQQEYLQAQSQMSLLTNERSRQQVLQQEEVGSKKKYQQAEAELGNLQAVSRALAMKLEILGCDMQALAQGKMSSNLTLKSPIDGFIQDQSLAIGKYITPTDVLVKIVGVAHKHVELKVFERDLAKLRIGQTIQFEGDGNKSTGKVFLVGKQVDMNTRLTPVHGHFSIDSDEQKFTVGQFVNAIIQVGEQKVLSIPQAGLARVGKGGYIYVEKTDGTMAQIPVEVRSADMEWVGIRPTKEMPEGKVVIRGASALEAIFAKD